MTRFAKIMLQVNLALSLLFAFWAFGVYGQRIDRAAEHKARGEQIQNLTKLLPPAEDRWRAAVAAADRAEAKRPRLQEWYQKQLTALKTGAGPVLAVDMSKGVVRTDPNGEVILGLILDATGKAIPDVASLAVLHQKYNQKQDAFRTVVQETDALVKQVQALSDEIGPRPPKPGTKKAYRTELALLLQEQKNSLNEQEFLKPLLYNRQEEVSILGQRHDQLKARVDELQGVTSAQKP